MSSDDDDLEEVLPTRAPFVNPYRDISPDASTSQAPLQITIRAPIAKEPAVEVQKKQKSEAESLERFVRLQAHRLHTIALLTNASIRNKWINDPLLHARLMSLTPLALQTSFTVITKKNQPDATLRGRQTETALVKLATWWSENFRIDRNKQGVRHQAYDDVAVELAEKAKLNPDPKGKGKGRAQDYPSDEEDDDNANETIRSAKSLMKHALMMRGSRDTSAQLFAALCRSLELPTRLIVSLQGVLWRRDKSGSGTTQKTDLPAVRARSNARKKARDSHNDAAEAARIAALARNAGTSNKNEVQQGTADVEDDEDNDDDMEEIFPTHIPPDLKGKGRATDSFIGNGQTLGDGPSRSSPPARSPLKSKPIIRLRKTRPKGRTLGEVDRAYLEEVLKTNSPPVFWVEVFSRPDGRWLAVDPINAHVDKRRKFEPASSDKFNHMLYVVAFEEDGYIRDVTPRYAKNFGTKILRERRTGLGKKDWWGDTTRFLTRRYRLHRDDLEDAEFEAIQALEGMPNSLSGFKDHPLYALERHLKSTEVIYPLTQIGTFRGEPVYSRSNVLPLKSAENWMRIGRAIKEGSHALKMAKVRAVTLGKKRALEQAKEDAEANGANDGAGLVQGLYAESQTALYVSDPIVNGKVPRNDFGNIDLYVPSMLPAGGVHVPYKGTAKIARQLGIDYAEAVTGFEFKQRKAFAVLTGIVIPIERESEFLEAYWKSAQAAEEKERQKKQERVIKHWSSLVQGLRVRKRLDEQYLQKGPESGEVSENDRNGEVADADAKDEASLAGGFLPADEESASHTLGYHVAPYALPKNLHVQLNPPVGIFASPSTPTA